MSKKLVAAFAALFALAACATAANYEARLNTWVGHQESELVSSWGPPINVYVAPDGTRVLTYNSSGNLYLPGTQPTYYTNCIGNTCTTNAVGGSPGSNIALSCTTNFTVRDNAIVSWRYQGNNCVALSR